jgi:endonuclease/exonuclease/phosphatase family metal-dependent hydrolase
VKNNIGTIFRRIFGSIVFLLNIAAALWLALCATAAFVSPLQIRYISLFSLTTPFAVITNLFFIFLWLFSSAKWRSVLSLLALVICYKVALAVFGVHFFTPDDMAAKPGKTIKIMTWNVHGMGIFNKPRSKEFENHIIEYMREIDADVMCLPEYYTPRIDMFKPHSNRILKNNGYKDFRYNVDNDLGPESYLGTAVFSKYPIRNYEVHQLSQYIFMLQGDIQLPNDSMIRMFFVHLTTFGLSDDDKALIEDVKRRNTDIDSGINKSKTFISKFNNAFVKRAREAIKASKIIEQSPYPVVVCGDFNDLPGSYTYTTLKRGGLKDAFSEHGAWLGRTYNFISPTLRIDHLLYSPAALKIIGFQTPRTNLSDHNPVIANFEIIGKPAN